MTVQMSMFVSKKIMNTKEIQKMVNKEEDILKKRKKNLKKNE